MTQGMQRLLVLGAGRYQIPVVIKAREMGLYVITTDNVPGNPGHSLSDKAYLVDTTDKDGILEIARAERINGIIAAATDVAVPTACFVAEALGLPAVPYEAANILCNKAKFREFLRAQGFPCPQFAVVDLARSRDFDPRSVGLPPWVMKPDFSSGSKGVFIVDQVAEYRHFLDETIKFARKEVVIEEYLVGRHGTAEGIAQGGAVSLCFVTDRHTVSPPFAATCGHRLPSYFGEEEQVRLLEQLGKLFGLLGIESTVFDCDFVVTSEEVYILEISPRLGGNSLFKVIRYSANFDIIGQAIVLALGGQPIVPQLPRLVPTAVLLFGVDKPGLIYYDVEEIQRLRNEKWVLELAMDYSPGEIAPAFTNGRNRAGEAVITAETRAELDRRVDELVRRVNIRTM